MHHMVATQEDALKQRLERAKAAPVKESKSERMAKIVGSAAEKESGKPTASPEIRKTHEDSKTKDPAKKTKKVSPTVIAWRDLDKDIPDRDGKQKITVLAKDKVPKRGDAAKRFGLYKDGMTVTEYIELSHKNTGVSKAGAREDIRWDVVKGFIKLS
jgi:hypothetical protein